LDQIWVYGNSFESSLVAVVVPKRDVLNDWAQKNGIEGGFEELVQNPKCKDFVLKELSATAKSSKVTRFLLTIG
jgi:long-chain acyl-CoA synthetase